QQETQHGGAALATAQFRHRDIVDWNGTPVYLHLPLQMETIVYERSVQEQTLFRTIESFSEQLATLGVAGMSAFADSVLRSAASSTFAADQRLREVMALLRPIRNAVVHGHTEQAEYQLS